jgi:hypothetical protein
MVRTDENRTYSEVFQDLDDRIDILQGLDDLLLKRSDLSDDLIILAVRRHVDKGAREGTGGVELVFRLPNLLLLSHSRSAGRESLRSRAKNRAHLAVPRYCEGHYIEHVSSSTAPITIC